MNEASLDYMESLRSAWPGLQSRALFERKKLSKQTKKQTYPVHLLLMKCKKCEK